MDDDSDRSSEATQLEETSSENEKKYDDEDDDGGCGGGFGAVSEDDYDDDDDDEIDGRRGVTAVELPIVPIEEDSRGCESETLVSDLADVPIKYEMRQDELEHLKNQLQGSHQEALANVIAQAAQVQSVNKIKLPGVPSSSSELSPTLATPISSLPSLTPISSLRSLNSQVQVQTPAVSAASIRVIETDLSNPSGSKPLSASLSVKTPFDGYNWRKYGQKQVKSPQGSRSYYKCTYTECDAKKMESCDQHNSVTKIVYKGQHKHDPPKKIFSRGGKIVSASNTLKRKTISTLALKEHRASGSVGNAPIQIEQMDAPEPKQRAKKISSASPGSVLKPPKKPKFVVHAAGDTEISADGYRWRKYGQKMVKGNPHPRNYYKCTSAGCPVRKHMEMAVDASEVIITYKGVHDHDVPVPKKRQGPPSGLLLLPASPSASKNTSQLKESEDSSPHVSTTEASHGVGERKTNEPARTLLSVGFEIQPC